MAFAADGSGDESGRVVREIRLAHETGSWERDLEIFGFDSLWEHFHEIKACPRLLPERLADGPGHDHLEFADAAV